MKFNKPPGWPDAPEGWVPDPTWTPDPAWTPPPPGWDFWTNDYGIPIRGPVGLYPNDKSSRRSKALLGTAAGLAGLIVGLMAGGGSTELDANTLALMPSPAAVTSTVRVPGPTVTSSVTVPGPERTVKVAGPTVTKTVTKTVRKTVTAVAPFAGSGGTAPKTSNTYYANCDAARAAGVAPLYVGEPGYRSGLDRDNDGVACE